VVATPEIPGHRIAGVLGNGGFATVYRGFQLAVGREVAVKVDNRVLISERDRRRFVREVTAAGRLSGHPHVVEVYDAGTLDDGRPYMVMEFCPGGSLNDVVRRDGPMTPARVRDIGVGIADALAAAHAAGILHRDIKPANILVNQYGMVGLSDFGLASILAAEGGQSVTREAFTPAYASPESFHGEEPTAAADLYSLAATLYALLAGRPPRFPPDGGSPSFATMLFLHDKPVDDVPGVPAELMALLRRSLAANPAVRPQSAAALRDTLRGIVVPPSGPQAPAMAAAVPQAQPGPPRAPTQDVPPAARGRHARQSSSGETAVFDGVMGSPGAQVGSFPDNAPTKSMSAGLAARRRGPARRLVALAAGLIVIIGAAAIGFEVLRPHAQPLSHASTVLYSFKDGTSDGWQAGANVATAAPVTSFLDGPKRPYDGTYALEGICENDAPVSAPRTMMVTPVSPLDLSAARTFYLRLDGYGYPQVATGFTATVTLTSGNRSMTKKVPIQPNTWNQVDVSVSSWPYRDHVTGISVSFAGTGSTIPWNPNFQIDDVGYST
jgi:tRNA A-37 threonylcarbamoyl transferase component Bud32